MGVGRQFKRQGEKAAAFGLWVFIFWFFSKPLRAWLFLFALLGSIILVAFLFDDRGDVFYVNSKSIELKDRPFGETVVKLNLNDSLVLLDKLSDNWLKVLVKNDTLYFHDDYLSYDKIGRFSTLEKTPLTKWKILRGQTVKLNHPDGYFDTGNSMLKNGDTITVIDFIENENSIKFKNDGGTFSKIKVEYLQIDWKSILKEYPFLDIGY